MPKTTAKVTITNITDVPEGTYVWEFESVEEAKQGFLQHYLDRGFENFEPTWYGTGTVTTVIGADGMGHIMTDKTVS